MPWVVFAPGFVVAGLRGLKSADSEVAGGVPIVAPGASQEVDSVKPGAKPENQGVLDEKG